MDDWASRVLYDAGSISEHPNSRHKAGWNWTLGSRPNGTHSPRDRESQVRLGREHDSRYVLAPKAPIFLNKYDFCDSTWCISEDVAEVAAPRDP